MHYTPSGELKKDLDKRIFNIQRMLCEKDIDAALFTGNTNLIYLTGRMIDGYCYIPNEGKAMIFSKANLEDAYQISRPEMILQIMNDLKMPVPKRIALEQDEISPREYIRLCRLFNAEIVDASMIKQARSIKTNYELELIKKTGEIHSKVYDMIPSLYEEAMTDTDLCIEIEYQLRKHGHIGIFRTMGFRMESGSGTVIAGDNSIAYSPYDFGLCGKGFSPALPVGTQGAVIKKGNTVLVDLAFNLYGYNTDMSRVFALGDVPKKAYDVHKVALEIQEQIMSYARIGTPCSELYITAQKIVSSYGLESCFMGVKRQAKFLGHGLGLDINERPVIMPKESELLKENMLIALEPKFALEGIGPVGIENTYVMTTNGFSRITVSDDNIKQLG